MIDIDNASAVVNATVSVNTGIDLGNFASVADSQLNITVTDNVAAGNRVDAGAFGSSGDVAGKMFIDASANDNGIYIEASESTETIKGGAGNDTLVGGLGIDSLVGGKGDDKFLVLGSATSGQVAGDIIVGGEGTMNSSRQ